MHYVHRSPRCCVFFSCVLFHFVVSLPWGDMADNKHLLMHIFMIYYLFNNRPIFCLCVCLSACVAVAVALLPLFQCSIFVRMDDMRVFCLLIYLFLQYFF